MMWTHLLWLLEYVNKWVKFVTFKEQLSQDTEKVFMNGDEFAALHTLNLKFVECVVMATDKDTDAQLQSKKGLVTSYKSIVIQTSLLNAGIPQPNDDLELDGLLFKVSASSEMEGMTFIDVTRPVGKFNKEIVIQKLTSVKVNGFLKETWIDDYACKAYIRSITADDLLKRGTTVNSRTIFVKIPYKEGITSKMRLIYKGLAYDITSVDNNEEDNVFMDLICEVSQ